jgi:hypothetical protein
MSSDLHATAFAPKRTGSGNEPSFIRAYIADFFKPVVASTCINLSSMSESAASILKSSKFDYVDRFELVRNIRGNREEDKGVLVGFTTPLRYF